LAAQQLIEESPEYSREQHSLSIREAPEHSHTERSAHGQALTQEGSVRTPHPVLQEEFEKKGPFPEQESLQTRAKQEEAGANSNEPSSNSAGRMESRGQGCSPVLAAFVTCKRQDAGHEVPCTTGRPSHPFYHDSPCGIQMADGSRQGREGEAGMQQSSPSPHTSLKRDDSYWQLDPTCQEAVQNATPQMKMFCRTEPNEGEKPCALRSRRSHTVHII
jgi:hypothetical protein